MLCCGLHYNLAFFIFRLYIEAMPRRGPYKRYDSDSTIPIPRQTVHNRRKRQAHDGTQEKHDEENNHAVGFLCNGDFIMNLFRH